jgi:hypothetical protein
VFVSQHEPGRFRPIDKQRCTVSCTRDSVDTGGHDAGIGAKAHILADACAVSRGVASDARATRRDADADDIISSSADSRRHVSDSCDPNLPNASTDADAHSNYACIITGSSHDTGGTANDITFICDSNQDGIKHNFLDQRIFHGSHALVCDCGIGRCSGLLNNAGSSARSFGRMPLSARFALC